MPEVLRSNDTWPLDVRPRPRRDDHERREGRAPTNEWWRTRP